MDNTHNVIIMAAISNLTISNALEIENYQHQSHTFEASE